MCGIVGYTGSREAVPLLLAGLRKLEYRGYDSAGVAVLTHDGRLKLAKKAGKIANLDAEVKLHPLGESTCGVGHTRWATHGAPTDDNAHPHLDCGGDLALVHNGIIENHAPLRRRLMEQGHRFRSQTDTEVLVHLIEEGLKRRSWEEAMRWALKQVEGTYSIVCLNRKDPGKIIAARAGGGALVVGLGKDEHFVASDVPALLPYTKTVFYLEDHEMVVLTAKGVRVSGVEDDKVHHKKPLQIQWSAEQAEKVGFPHFMLKEIMEQPRALLDTLLGRLDPMTGKVSLDSKETLTPTAIVGVKRILLLACGTSYYAALVGKFLLEENLRIPVEVDYADEFRYRKPVVGRGDLAIVISQSGETVDTLVALREARQRGARVGAICNVMGSSVDRESDFCLITRAGPEIGVASTKAFTTQLAAFWLLTLDWAAKRHSLPPERLKQLGKELSRVPTLASQTLKNTRNLKAIAKKFASHYNFLYLGRGLNYPIALEGALKLKEISYIHAEGYPGGEMKHGPIALIDAKMPVVAIVLKSTQVYEKMINNMEEVKARHGRLIAVVEKGDVLAGKKAESVIEIPKAPEGLTPILSILPLQLLAYYVAVRLKREIDQPRNLAKSVTVE
jgi:glucosamine--fructose-6-phosphate aminotransferase (isomerizing)